MPRPAKLEDGLFGRERQVLLADLQEVTAVLVELHALARDIHRTNSPLERRALEALDFMRDYVRDVRLLDPDGGPRRVA